MKNITSIRCGIMRFISLIILLVLGLFTLNGCSHQTVKKTNDITYNKEKINTIEEMEIKEESFLFYDDTFTIILPYSLEFLNTVKEIRFFLHEDHIGTISNQDTSKISLNENKIIINEDSPLNDFNRIEVINSDDQAITLNTGLYSFDNSVKYTKLPEGKKRYQKSSHIIQEGKKIVMTFGLTNTPDAEIRFRLPDSTEGILINPKTKLLSENESTSSYQFEVLVNQSYLLNKGLDNISFELIVEQQFRDLHHVISKSFIPIDIQTISDN